MRPLHLTALLLSLLLLTRASYVQAQTQPRPCNPPPGTSNMITCYGNTPCPTGYLDPVGPAERNLRQNPADPNETPWLCIQNPPPQAGDSSGDQSAAGAVSAPAPPAPAISIPVITTTLGLFNTSPLGPFLTNNQGLTLYIRTSDSSGVSTCNDACAIIWPPLAPPTGDLTLPDSAGGTLATLTRTDGTQQLSYNGMPLYTYTGDFQPGDTNGQGLDATTAQGVSGAWKVATP
jgi:predicted lipoprotein with Yx(FWY)xxD motif